MPQRLLTMNIVTLAARNAWTTGVRYAPLQEMISHLVRYRPTLLLTGIISGTRFDRLLVDAPVKHALDRVIKDDAITADSFLETLDEYLSENGLTARFMQRGITAPARAAERTERFELIVVAKKENIALINAAFRSRETITVFSPGK